MSGSPVHGLPHTPGKAAKSIRSFVYAALQNQLRQLILPGPQRSFSRLYSFLIESKRSMVK